MFREVVGPANWKKQNLAESDWLRDLAAQDVSEADRLESVSQNIATTLETGVGVLLLRNTGLEQHDDEVAKQRFLKLMSRVGTAVSQSSTGDLVFSVRDAGFKEDDTRARGPNTKKKLSFHTDRCDVIAFLCLQQAKSGGENQVVSSVAIYNEIRQRRPDLLSVLMKPFLYKRHNVDTGNALAFCEQPIFSFCEEKFACAFLRVLIDRAYADEQTPDISPEQKEALDFLESVAAEPEMQLRFVQEPGDILLLNNWITLHRRTAFEDWPDPERRRHILRIWLSMPNSRPLDPLFKANYGAVEAGAIRGGMPPTA
ncbi:MAG: TauD/TfdA family dioxygenase [Planctomycetaceae bacterium]